MKLKKKAILFFIFFYAFQRIFNFFLFSLVLIDVIFKITLIWNLVIEIFFFWLDFYFLSKKLKFAILDFFFKVDQ